MGFFGDLKSKQIKWVYLICKWCEGCNSMADTKKGFPLPQNLNHMI